jgi:hypothetical protein
MTICTITRVMVAIVGVFVFVAGFLIGMFKLPCPCL